MPDPLLRAIPYPQPTLDSIKETVLALKAVVELLAGMHGHTNNAGRSARYEELLAQINRINVINVDIADIEALIALIEAEIDALWANIASATDVLTGTNNTKFVTSLALAALWEKSVASFSTGVLTLGNGGYFNFTSAGETITDIDFATPKDGRRAWVRVLGSGCTLVHGANLVLQGLANISCAAGDRFLVVQDVGDAAVVLEYIRASGLPVIGPASVALDSNIALYDGLTGKLIKDSNVGRYDGTNWAFTRNFVISKVTPSISLIEAGGSNVMYSSGNFHFIAVDAGNAIANSAFVVQIDALNSLRVDPLGSYLYAAANATPTGGSKGVGTLNTKGLFVDGVPTEAFPTGTKMLFVQTAAPTGWTKDTTHNDKALRVVSGTASSGGTHAFSTVFGKTATDNFTLTSAQQASMFVGILAVTGGSLANPGNWLRDTTFSFGPSNTGTGSAFLGNTGLSSPPNAAGSGGAHSHGMDIRVQYVDTIIATKN